MRRWGLLACLVLAAARPAAGQSRPRLTDRGLDSLRQDAAIDSMDAEAQYRLGLGLWEKHKFDAADSSFRRAIRLQPWHAGAHLALGILPSARGDRYVSQLVHRLGQDSAGRILRAAEHEVAEATVLDPRHDLTPLGFLTDDELVPNSVGISFDEFGVNGAWRDPADEMRRAIRAIIGQHPDTAFAILSRALAARRPNQVMQDRFISLYATAALRSGHPEAAADGYRELAQRAGRTEANGTTPFDRRLLLNFRGHYLLLYGIAEAEAHQLDVARAAFHEAVVTEVGLYEAHAQLADLAESQGDLEGALAERRAAVTAAPESARPSLDLGITLLQAGRAAEAEAALNDAAGLLPWDPAIELFRFQAAMAAHDRATAARALDALDRYAPRRNHDQVADAHRRFAAEASP